MIERFYLLLFAVLFTSNSFGQLTPEYPPVYEQTTVKKQKILKPVKEDKSAPCGVDTLYYARYNNSNTSPQYLNLQPTRGAGMFFAIDDTVWLHGFNFFAYALAANGFLTSQSVTCKVYYANSSKLPAGIALASATYSINALGFTVPQLRQKFLFNNPVMLVSDFIVTIEFAINLTNRIVLASNDYNNGDGLGKNFSSVKLSTGWSNNLIIGTTPFDADFFIEPVVEYNMSPQFDHGSNSCLGNGKPFEFINTTTFATNPQFSKEAMDSTLDDNFIWDYGDGSAADTMLNGLHLYSGTVGYFVKLSGTFSNWRGNICKADTNIFLTESDVKAKFQSSPNGLIVTFTDNSTNATSWDWDFGDGSFGSTQKNPVHVYSTYSLYLVKLKVKEKGCVDSATMALDLQPTAINELSSNEMIINIGPNPASEYLTVTGNLGANERGTWNIFSIQGRMLKSGKLMKKQDIFLDGFEKGVYFINFESGGKQLTMRFVVK